MEKTHINICTSSAVDSGKSTLMGHLIFKLGGISAREMEKLNQRAAELNKSSFAFAFYLDTTKEEQARGITIQTTCKEFYTDKYHYTAIDNPGHKDFIKNMICGASQVEVALLLIPADGNFISSIQKSNPAEGVIEGQGRAHARILNLLGIKQLIVVINKMDERSVNYSQDRFNEVRDETIRMLTGVGYKRDYVESSIPIIPISAFQGDNLIEPCEKMPWWTGIERVNLNGDKVKIVTLLDALNNFVTVPKRNLESPLRFPVSGVYKIKGVGDVLTGRIEQGSLKPNDELIFLPTHTTALPCSGKVFSIERHHRQIDSAIEGDNIGISVKGLDKANMPKTGDIAILKKDNTLGSAKEFVAQIQVIEHPGELKVGYTPIACVRTAKAPVKIKALNWKMGKETGGAKLIAPTSIKTGEMAEVVFEPILPFVVEKFTKCEGLGRLAVFEGMSLVFIGKVTDVTY